MNAMDLALFESLSCGEVMRGKGLQLRGECDPLGHGMVVGVGRGRETRAR